MAATGCGQLRSWLHLRVSQLAGPTRSPSTPGIVCSTSTIVPLACGLDRAVRGGYVATTRRVRAELNMAAGVRGERRDIEDTREEKPVDTVSRPEVTLDPISAAALSTTGLRVRRLP